MGWTPHRSDQSTAFQTVHQGIECPCGPFQLAVGQVERPLHYFVSIGLLAAQYGEHHGLEGGRDKILGDIEVMSGELYRTAI